MTSAALVARAIRAFLREPGSPQPTGALASHNERDYVVLHNVTGTLAVYRVAGLSRVLKRLKRWPKEIAPATTGAAA